MAVTSNLLDRIEAEFAAAEQRVKQLQSQKVQEFQDRQQRLEKLDQALEQLREIWRPRLEALAKKFGERVNVSPQVEPARRSATFEFKSELAHIKLKFGVAPDAEVKNIAFTYDLDIIPILMKFNSHEVIDVPLDAIDKERVAKWFDDRIVDFVKTYLALHENQYYLKEHMVEDPIAKVRFPKYAAGATCEHNGKTHYFIDDTTRKEFERQNK
jgi:hypothetical protein